MQRKSDTIRNLLEKIKSGHVPTSDERKFLDELQVEAQGSTGNDETNGKPAPAEFKNPLAVATWLKDDGWAIGKSQVYGHIKEGKLRADLPEGRYSIHAVRKYASMHLTRSRTRQKLKEEDIQYRKLQADIRKTEAEAKRAELKLAIDQGKYVLMEDVERMLAGRAVLMDTMRQASILNHAAERVAIMGGEASKIADLIEMDMAHHADEMNAFASWEEFRAILPANQEEKISRRDAEHTEKSEG